MPELQVEATVKNLSYRDTYDEPMMVGKPAAAVSKKKKPKQVMEVRLEDNKGHSYCFELDAKEAPPKLGSTAMIQVVMEYADEPEYKSKNNPKKEDKDEDNEGEKENEYE
jgi:hypothetical protein